MLAQLWSGSPPGEDAVARTWLELGRNDSAFVLAQWWAGTPPGGIALGLESATLFLAQWRTGSPPGADACDRGDCDYELAQWWAGTPPRRREAGRMPRLRGRARRLQLPAAGHAGSRETGGVSPPRSAPPR